MTKKTATHASFKGSWNNHRNRLTVFDSLVKSNRKKGTIFLDEDGPVSIQRYDDVKYPQFDKLTEKQLGYFWRPQEIDLNKDTKDFRDLAPHEQHIFISNIKRQIVLDSIQGRAPSLTLLPIVSNPEVEAWIQTWTFFETIHSRSYTHIIRNIYNDPSKVFDGILDVAPIVECANSISGIYDNLGAWMSKWLQNKNDDVITQELKTSIWLSLHAANALEGIRFYVSFACAWAFAELKKMEGNAKIIKLICRDENLHLASTQQLIKILPSDDKYFKTLSKDRRVKEMIRNMYMDVVEQEKKWAEYLFAEGTIIGLNVQLLSDYIEWIGHKRMTSISIDSPYSGGSNPLPWTQKWIAGSDVQTAPQETAVSSYIVGGVKNDIGEDTFKGFKL